jgi:hypothetical protein
VKSLMPERCMKISPMASPRAILLLPTGACANNIAGNRKCLKHTKCLIGRDHKSIMVRTSRQRLPHLAYNRITITGAILALVSFLTIAFLLIMGFFGGPRNPYIGIVTYLLLPPFMIIGLIMIPAGMWRTRRRERKGIVVPYRLGWPVIDLNMKAERNGALIFFSGTLLLILISTVGIYKTYQYTESIAFCGRVCHRIMRPQFTTHNISSHARVKCTSCHIGPGASWFAKSKISGLYQVYATIADIYHRPIPIPIKDLRPTELTCYECHWPQKFYGVQQAIFDHYMYTKGNSSWPITMLIKIGGSPPGQGKIPGIHWYMNIGYTIEYIARDSLRLDIPWMKATDRQTGEVTIYQDESNPLPPDSIDTMKRYLLDCVACHTSPTHVFLTPDEAIDQAILAGRIDSTIPDIKIAAVQAAAQNYSTGDSAMTGIRNGIIDYYHKNDSSYYVNHIGSIDSAISATQHEFDNNIFPDMKVRWSVYPDNIGHFYYKGCFSCHLGNTKSKDGKVVSHDCKSCHLIVAQRTGPNGPISTSLDGLEFVHPVDIYAAWQEMGCYECHSGVQP